MHWLPSPSPCSPVIRQCSWKKTQIEKKRYRFTSKASSFGLFSRKSSVTSVKISVCLFQQVECAWGYKFINLNFFFFCFGMSLSNWTHGKNKHSVYLKISLIFWSHCCTIGFVGITCRSSAGKLPYFTNRNTWRSLFYNFELSTTIFANGKCF